MMHFGPVAQAASGGHGSPTFDLIVGFVVLTLTWVGFFRKEERKKAITWIAIGISAICGIFIYSGVTELIR
jgi:RsiW-degrading membrane proteinase PrsW (M82 family)